MRPTSTLRQKFAQFVVVFLPIFITQLALSAMAFFDTSMTGHVSPAAQAGVSIGVSLWMPIQTGLNGVLNGIMPIVSQLVGGGRERDVRFNVFQALLLSLLFSAAVLLLGALLLRPAIEFMNADAEVADTAYKFLICLAFGVVPLFAYTVLRGCIDALGQTRVSMAITLCSLPVQLLLNYLLIFGKFGFPKLGGVGAGIASAVTYWVIFLIALAVMHRAEPFASFGFFRKRYAVSWPKQRELLKLGIPIGFATFFETSIFAAVTLLMNRFGTNAVAAHSAAINFASTLYMIPLAICMALTILVGYEAGGGRHKDARQYASIGIGSAVFMALLTAVVLLLFGDKVALIYSTDPTVTALIVQFLGYAIFFQLSDALATPIQGALRGYKDVTPAFFITLIAYWGIGLPLGFALAVYTPLGPFGYWLGLIAGLAVGAVLLLLRLFKVQRINGRGPHPADPAAP
ncbi:MATE family efflux transporter [Saccharibacillus alkalitolerans]|uniref:Probable multidrug resistance protein NorM n=1 Tax=Saccharibacillus alkalitolerans TaxID=2705290 RepID=A0ABX0F6T9_9BACL|nr:MATE family efflux transporter [Saccharibacillus alkalitolerans]NGZ75714.1 MATE family efflux transporter [Saccharibacillus alkalitolerans]